MSSERQAINKISPWWGEHLHRYKEVVKNFKGNESALDIACGTGFGTHFMATKTAAKVYGGDLSHDAITLCNESWESSNLSYQLMDGTQLPFEDHFFDAVISFETIEHTTQFVEMLQELKRVTKPSGLTIISTPNILVNSPTGIVTNPFHTQEWNYEELQAILTNVFADVKIYGQQYSRYVDNKNRLGQFFEQLFYSRGIRKLPIKIQDAVMKLLIGKPMYPIVEDYKMVSTVEEIKKCKTFYCICKK